MECTFYRRQVKVAGEKNEFAQKNINNHLQLNVYSTLCTCEQRYGASSFRSLRNELTHLTPLHFLENLQHRLLKTKLKCRTTSLKTWVTRHPWGMDIRFTMQWTRSNPKRHRHSNHQVKTIARNIFAGNGFRGNRKLGSETRTGWQVLFNRRGRYQQVPWHMTRQGAGRAKGHTTTVVIRDTVIRNKLRTV